jgi:hypothetical protein
MNIQEGARRLKLAGLWLIAVPLCLGLLGWVVALFVSLLHHQFNFFPLDVIMILFCSLIPGGTIWLTGWIMEGFAKESR